jgi:hypothetical protein
MGDIVVQTTIERTPDDVFAYLRRHDNQITWQAPNVLEVAVEPPGPSGLGTKVHKVRKTPMGRMAFTEEITAFDATGRSWTETTVSGGLRGTRVTWQVLESGSGADVRLSAEMHGAGFSRLLLRIIRKQASRSWEGELAELKRLLESGAGTGEDDQAGPTGTF